MFHSVNAGFHTDSPCSTICPSQPLKWTPVEPKHHHTSSMSTLCKEKPKEMSSTDLTWPLCFVSPLSKPLVTHHDPENTFNSIIEPPSVVDQPSPSWSSQESFSSFENSEDGPVYCVPHEGEDIRHLSFQTWSSVTVEFSNTLNTHLVAISAHRLKLKGDFCHLDIRDLHRAAENDLRLFLWKRWKQMRSAVCWILWVSTRGQRKARRSRRSSNISPSERPGTSCDTRRSALVLQPPAGYDVQILKAADTDRLWTLSDDDILIQCQTPSVCWGLIRLALEDSC